MKIAANARAYDVVAEVSNVEFILSILEQAQTIEN